MINPNLKVFITVAECGSFSKAAEQIFISSTAIMKQMNQLEAHIGLPLLIRTNHGITLTEAGKSIYEDAKFLLSYSDQSIQRAYKKQLKDQYIIRLGSSMLYPAKELIDLWNRISTSYPQFKLRIIPFEDIAKESGFQNIGINFDIAAGAFGRTGASDLHFLKLSEFHFAIAMPAKHPLASKKILTYDNLHGEHLMIMQTGNSPVNDHIRNDIEKEHPQIILENAPYHYDIDTFNRCEESGMLLLTLDEWKDIHPSLITIPLKVPYTIPYGIISSAKPNEATRMFLNIVRQM